jgi:hypothetical protein
MFYTNSTETSYSIGEFYECKGNNVPELIQQIPPSLDVEPDWSVNENNYDDPAMTARVESESSPDDRSSRQYVRRQHYNPPNPSYRLSERDEALRQPFDDQSVEDENEQQAIMLQRDRHRGRYVDNRHRPPGEADPVTSPPPSDESPLSEQNTDESRRRYDSNSTDSSAPSVNAGLVAPAVPVTSAAVTAGSTTASPRPISDQPTCK